MPAKRRAHCGNDYDKPNAFIFERSMEIGARLALPITRRSCVLESANFDSSSGEDDYEIAA